MLLSEFIAEFPDFDREAGEALGELAQQVHTSDRKGAFTVAVDVSNKKQRVITQLTHSAKPPKPDPEAGLFFVTDKGLTKDDPWQTSLDDIDPATGEIRPKENR